MLRVLTFNELSDDCDEIVRALDRGDRFVVTHQGMPVADLTPVHRHRSVSTTTLLSAFAGAPTVDAERFRVDLDAGLASS